MKQLIEIDLQDFNFSDDAEVIEATIRRQGFAEETKAISGIAAILEPLTPASRLIVIASVKHLIGEDREMLARAGRALRKFAILHEKMADAVQRLEAAKAETPSK